MLFSSEGDFARIHENVMGRALLGGDFFLVEETRKTCLLGGDLHLSPDPPVWKTPGKKKFMFARNRKTQLSLQPHNNKCC